MSNNENWMDSFRTKNRKIVYVLTVRIVEEGKEVKSVREVVDCPKGEVGIRYVNNLLCRLANEAIRGTDIEKFSWRECPDLYWNPDKGHVCIYTEERQVSDKDYAYMRSKDRRNYAMAEMKWYEQLPEKIEFNEVPDLSAY